MTKQELDNQIVDKKLVELTPDDRNNILRFFIVGKKSDHCIVTRPIGQFATKMLQLNLLVEKKQYSAYSAEWGHIVHKSTDKEAVLVLTNFGKIVRDKLDTKS